MFTGIVSVLGAVISIEGDADRSLDIEAPSMDAARLRIGDSISVQGVCLTVTRFHEGVFSTDVSRETLRATSLGALRVGDRVNLEPALRVGDALGGHWVSGHVDGTADVVALAEEARSRRMQFDLPAELGRFVAPKGSICLDGVSLTVNSIDGIRFDVNIIPHTLEFTTLGALRVGDRVNVEIDLVARYLERLIAQAK